jgi:UDP-N-acetylglucosamine pyrophosphorylase
MQNNLPAVDKNGKIILKDEFEIFMAPNGNGGLYEGI